MKKLIIILSTFLLINFAAVASILYFFVPFCFGGGYPAVPDPLPADTLLTPEQAASDRDMTIQFVEDAHPYFIFQDDLTAYEQARQLYINLTAHEMTVGEFQTATAQYLCFFRDGHTRIRWTEEEYLALEQAYQNGKNYCLENGIITDKYIVEIGGTAIDHIYKTIDKLIPAENDMAEQYNREIYVLGRNLLQEAGADIRGGRVTVSFSDGSSAEFSFLPPDKSENVSLSSSINSWQMSDDIFQIDFAECIDDENLQSIADALENALQQGCRKVIIDARGNGGGNSNACERLLKAMGMTAPEYDVVIRYSSEAKEQAGYLRSSGTYRYKGSDKSQTNDAVRLAVLCDRYTFSSANMLCVWVRDGDLGVIIGEPSTNSPSHYGDILYLSLPNSHIFATVSHKHFVRPDEYNTETMLIPDIQTSSEEAYAKALEYMKQ